MLKETFKAGEPAETLSFHAISLYSFTKTIKGPMCARYHVGLGHATLR